MEPMPRLCDLPALVARVAGALRDVAAVRPERGGFALVEHLWHLADLEVEAFQLRVARLLKEPTPWLADFDGDRAARERGYLARPLASGLRAFTRARQATVRAFAAVPADGWLRAGLQEGVGYVTLAELPSRVLGHDRAHARELADLVAELRPTHPVAAELRSWVAEIVDPPAPPCGRRAAALRTPAALPLSRIQRVVASHLSRGLDVRGLARVLDLPPRTLQRRLAEHGVTVRCLLDAARRARAIQRMHAGDDWRTAAAELGFSDPRAFARAFKRWTRTTPLAFQRAPTMTRRGCA